MKNQAKSALFALAFLGFCATAYAQGEFKSFPIYTDANSPDNHYVPSGWMGDYGDIRIDDKFLARLEL